MLRAVRHLLDDASHDVISLRLTSERDLSGLVDDLAAAVYWVPSPVERVSAGGLRGRVAGRRSLRRAADSPRCPSESP